MFWAYFKIKFNPLILIYYYLLFSNSNEPFSNYSDNRKGMQLGEERIWACQQDV